MKPLKRILLTTDFSDHSLATFEYAVSLYKFLRIQIYMLHVLDKKELEKKTKSEKNSNQNSKDATGKATKQLTTLANKYLFRCGEIKKVVRYGEPFKEIVKFASEEKIDLILICTHGRTGVLRTLMGSVAEKVVRYSSIPVLTVKPRKVQMKLMEQEDVDEQLHMKSNYH